MYCKVTKKKRVLQIFYELFDLKNPKTILIANRQRRNLSRQ